MIKHPNVTNMVAIVKDKTNLVGFFSQANVDINELRVIVSSVVPNYMVPDVFIGLDTLPTNVNGKK